MNGQQERVLITQEGTVGFRPVSGGPPFRADLARSVRLFRAFGLEQTDPDHFYGMLARDTVAQLCQYTGIDGATILDIGGGAGYFSDALRDAGGRVVCVDCDAGELRGLRGAFPAGSVLGSALALPFADGTADICFSSNVLEHVPQPEAMADEMVRVTRPGGIVYLSYTNWLSPWGGHETSPWHYLGGDRAARRYERRRGHGPKNRFGESLYAVSVAQVLRWARARTDVEILSMGPRYHPRWATWVVAVPGLRELVTWNLLLVLRKR